MLTDHFKSNRFTCHLIIGMVLFFGLSCASANQDNVKSGDERAVYAFEDYHFSLYMQDLMMHRFKYALDTLNDSQSSTITQSALIKRFALRYKISEKINLGTSLRLSLRDEKTFIDDEETDSYHLFKALSPMLGYRYFVMPFSRSRIEGWLNLRTDLSLSERFLSQSALHGDLEFNLAINEATLVTLGVDLYGNRNDGLFYAIQYGFGWRF